MNRTILQQRHRLTTMTDHLDNKTTFVLFSILLDAHLTSIKRGIPVTGINCAPFECREKCLKIVSPQFTKVIMKLISNFAQDGTSKALLGTV